MGLGERLFDAMAGVVRTRLDVDRNAADIADVNARILDHERRLIRLKTLGEMRTVEGRARRQRIGSPQEK